MGGDSGQRRAQVIDGFNNGLNRLVMEIGFDPNAAERFKNTFGELLD